MKNDSNIGSIATTNNSGKAAVRAGGTILPEVTPLVTPADKRRRHKIWWDVFPEHLNPTMSVITKNEVNV